MLALFGVPLCGSLFVPLVVGLVTISIIWVFVLSKNTVPPNGISSDELQKLDLNSSEKHQAPVKVKEQKKKKKSCGSNGNCCSKKDGKLGRCSSKSRAIKTARLFTDQTSGLTENFAEVLSKQLPLADVSTEIIHLSNADVTSLPKYADGSLCIFLIDDSNINRHHQWQNQVVSPQELRPLAGMKYAVFAIESTIRLNGSKNDVAVDQWLHKSGAVRVCKAGRMDTSASDAGFQFGAWTEDLLAQIQGWNTSKKKACTCSPKKKNPSPDEEQNSSCSSSSDCSDSEGEENLSVKAPKPVLDLEDLAQILKK